MENSIGQVHNLHKLLLEQRQTLRLSTPMDRDNKYQGVLVFG